MARGEQLIRQHRILRLLAESRQGLSLERLRDDLVQQVGLTALSTRTVRRDLEALQAAGYAVEACPEGSAVRWRLMVSSQPPSAVVSCHDLLAVSLANDLLRPLHGSQVSQAMVGSWNTLTSSASPAVRRQFERLRSVYEVVPSDPRHASNIATGNREVGIDNVRLLPEPSSLALLVLGLAAVLAGRWRRGGAKSTAGA